MKGDTTDLIKEYIDKQGITITALAESLGMSQVTLWRNLNKKTKMRLEIYRNILNKLGITEDELFSINENINEKYFINDEISVTGAAEEGTGYKSKVEKLNNKDKTILDQAQALKMANEQIGKLIDMNMKLIETISELNKKIDMKMILVFSFMIISFHLEGQCKNRPKSSKGNDTAVIVGENVKSRIANYLVQSGASIDTTTAFFFTYDTGFGYILNGSAIIEADTCLLFTNYDYNQKKSGVDILNTQHKDSGKSYHTNMLNDQNASFSWDYFKCLLVNIPNIRFIKREVPKF